MTSAFAASLSLEAPRPRAADIAAIAGVLPKGTAVYLSAVPGATPAELVATAAKARRAGLDPVAHVAARRIAGTEQLSDLLKALRGEADMRQLLVIGGDVDQAGPYADALAVLQKGALREMGFETIGIAAYPEGHAKIPPGRLEASLDEKIASATAQGLRVQLVSQFSFSPERVLTWLRQLRASGIAVPVKVGMARPTSVPALLRYAKRCGVAASLRGLVSGVGASLVGQITTGSVGPDRMIDALATAEAQQRDLGDIAPHYFSFGGVLETACYACEAASATQSPDRAMARPNSA